MALGRPPRRDAYDAVIVFGGEANVDEEESHPWLIEEKAWIGELLERGVPLLGVCLGAQLIAEVAGARVERLAQPEVGWHEVTAASELLPDRFLAFEWHRYGFETAPPGAIELARNRAGCQAFTLGNALAIQFHAEVDRPTVSGWIRDYGPEVGVDAQALAAETAANIAAWNEFGRGLCRRWLATAR